MPRIVKEMCVSDLPSEWRTEVGSAKTVRVTIEPIASKEEDGGSPSFEEFMEGLTPIKLKDGWDAVRVVRSMRDGLPGKIVE